MCNAVASNGGRSLCVQISRERSYTVLIDTTRKTIDCATTLPLTVFKARCNARIASAVLATAIPSDVRPSVRLSHVGIVSKRRHV